MIEIRYANFPDDLGVVSAIFREYVNSASANLDFQDYEAEFAGLPGKYAPPDGRLLLAWRDDKVVGCVALRRVDANTCEMKRVYVHPGARGENLGRRLVEQILSEARATGYSRICLDVLPEFVAAQRIYESLGFTSAPPITFNPIPGTKFLGLDL
ncbi:GNAT family N-acetyltransferase [Caballeronia sp. SEWSISQ10-4 2]|uniref:GNAT family N-acetyltransferase n=1 Tax=Caballeronia sp. SEWSISQ10-4 2 TaxID=2937438 RepID=UPI002655732B|nr:GNAT family N-acetyltransferase [Caballeronia sp. SEWSISQ10-4 2]MDN7182245.1 GNAT family N-acetyltransferase [Caballeronia sp. SEWSISQ10-4 2]